MPYEQRLQVFTTADHNIPVGRQDDDICDLLQILQEAYLGGRGYDAIDCTEIRYSLERILAEGVKYPRLHFILHVTKLLVKYKFRRFWCERVDDTACKNLFDDFTRPEYLDRWCRVPFTTAYDEMLERFYELAAAHSYALGVE
jgi:hypothetical protein